MEIKDNLNQLINEYKKFNYQLIAVSKNHSSQSISQAYEAGQRHFGENKVQEMTEKYETLPKDIQWHMIGHLQRNKVKYIVPYVYLIHSVDSLRLLEEINKEAKKQNRSVNCLLQIYIAREDTKYGFSESELLDLFQSDTLNQLKNVQIVGFMGMASNTDNIETVRQEFRGLNKLYQDYKTTFKEATEHFQHLSMGMSGDAGIALEEGSTMIRVGSAIFGNRTY